MELLLKSIPLLGLSVVIVFVFRIVALMNVTALEQLFFLPTKIVMTNFFRVLVSSLCGSFLVTVATVFYNLPEYEPQNYLIVWVVLCGFFISVLFLMKMLFISIPTLRKLKPQYFILRKNEERLFVRRTMMDGSILLSNKEECEEEGSDTYYIILEKNNLQGEKIYRYARKVK